MRFASKAELLEQVEGEHGRLLELLASIPKVRWRDAGVWGDDWTIQDLVAHVMEWQVMFLRWYRQGREGGAPELPAPGYKWNQTPELNRAIWRKHRRIANARLMEEFDRSYRDIRDLVVALPPAELLTPGYFEWTGTCPLTTYLAANTSSHYRFATRILRRWLRRPGVRTGRSPGCGSRRNRGG